MKTKPQHSPLPWRTNGRIISADGAALIADLRSEEDSHVSNVTTEEAKSNGVLIVRAVNSHEALVEIAMEYERQLVNSSHDGSNGEAIIRVMAALKLAGEDR